jgi:hypothetical protein
MGTREDLSTGKRQCPTDSVQHISIVNPMKLFLPPLHIKLEFIKYLVKSMAKEHSEGFQ